MKKYSLILFCLLSIINTSCTKTLTIDKVTERNKIVYENSTQKPFTGVVKEEANGNKPGFYGQFINGKPEGKHTTFNKDKTIFSECNYIDGKRNGKSIIYHTNGKKTEINFKEDLKHGEEIEYSSEGKIESIRYYENNEEIYK